ncbi:reverse transcriptase domain-containing protein [Tanacetum coccineum]
MSSSSSSSSEMTITSSHSIIDNFINDSDIDIAIRRIDSVNTAYSKEQKTIVADTIKNEHLYSANANEIDEKKPKLKDLPSHLEYAYLHGNECFPIIISSKLSEREKKLLLQVLENYKGAIAWKMLDMKGISPSFCTHKIHMEDDFKPVIQPQRRLNPKVQDVVKNEIIPIALEDQEKTTFTYPYGTFAYKRMPFGLCNATVTFQQCMTTIFHDMVEDFLKVFMDDFLEKCHFMVKEGIVLGHKILGSGIEVDKAKIDVIAKLPYPTNVKGVRSFLGHARFYRRFIKDFSMISKPMTQLLLKDAKFDFFDDCKKAFNILKEKLTTAPIIISPDWNIPFELMCDASDYAVGVVLGELLDGKFKLIYYASKMLNNAQEHYTTTEKELLAVVFAFEKSHPYLILSKTMAKVNDVEPWYVDFVNYIVGKVVPPKWTFDRRKRFYSQVKNYFWDKPYAFKLCPDNIMRRCVAGSEIFEILAHCHSGPTGGHHSASVIRRRSGNISSRNEMPQNNIQVCEVFDIWGLDFMGPFLDSRGNKYALVAVDYMSKWVEAQALPTNDARVEIALQKYGVTHKLSTAHHPQSNGQTEVTNKAIKRILERSLGYNPKDWSEKLNDALWAFRPAYKTPTRCTPSRLVYGKACHLPVEIEHKTYLALKQCNMDLTAASKNRFMQLNELGELRDRAYKNTRIYKERTKKWHDSRLRGDKYFKVGDKVLLFNSHFKMHPGKLKSKWYGLNTVKTVYPYGAIEITDKNGFSFKVNGQRLKKYYEGNVDKEDDEVIDFEADPT